MTIPDELKLRTRSDYDLLPINRAHSTFEKLTSAVTSAYHPIILAAAATLRAGKSVLIEGPARLAETFCEALREPLNRNDTDTFYFISLKDAISSAVVIRRPEDPVKQPANEIIFHSLQIYLSGPARRDTIGVFQLPLDALCTAGGSEQADLLALLCSYPDAPLLAFVTPGGALPIVLRERFGLRLSLPPLDRAILWKLFSFDEVQNLLGASPGLSIAHQIALYHLSAGMDVISFRVMIEAWANRQTYLSNPLQIIADMRHERMGSGKPSYVAPSILSPDSMAELQENLIRPLRQMNEPQIELATLLQLDANLPRGILLKGSETFAIEAAEWAANQLNAVLIQTTGAHLSDAHLILSRAVPAPAIVLIRNLDEGELSGQELYRQLLLAWSQLPPALPIILMGHLPVGSTLPAPLYRRFTMQMNG